MTTHDHLSRRAFLRLLMGAAAGLAIPIDFVGAQGEGTNVQEGAAMRIRFTFADQDFTATLEDNASARDLLTMLPLDLTITDFSSDEKIVHLPRRLTVEDTEPGDGEAIGDLCYYIPWGNLAMFYGPYRLSRDLIRLGRLDNGAAPLLVRGAFPVHIEALS